MMTSTPRLTSLLRGLIDLTLALAFLTLPYTHLRWLPPLGTTRPVASILFLLALGLVYLEQGFYGGWKLTDLLGINFLRRHLPALPGWEILRWWLFLFGLGVISALFTPFYGNTFQAANRLLGYAIIFTTLYCGLVALQRFGGEKIATLISLGYLPALIYGMIEVLMMFKLPWARDIVVWVRSHVIVEVLWNGRLSLFATEPSFVSFQLLLLLAILPWVRHPALRIADLVLVTMGVVFSLSGNLLIQVGIYAAVLVYYRLSQRARMGIAAVGAGAAGLAGLIYAALPAVRSAAARGFMQLMEINRVYRMVNSARIRGSYTQNLVWSLVETRGLGLGIGQYGHFWRSIYLRHFDLAAIDTTGEITATLASSEYMRPWSVILGIGVDLGLVGLAIFLAFLVDLWRRIPAAHGRAVWFASLAALSGAYPIVTPHVWLALAFLVGVYAAPLPVEREEAA